MSEQRHRDIQAPVDLLIRDRNSHWVIGLTSQGNIDLDRLSRRELNRAGRGRVRNAWIVHRWESVLLTTRNRGRRIVVHELIGYHLVSSRPELGEAELRVRVRVHG